MNALIQHHGMGTAEKNGEKDGVVISFFFWQMWMHFVACVHQTVMSRYVLMLQNIIGIKGGN